MKTTPRNVLNPHIPEGMKGRDLQAFKALFKAGADGVITKREADAFASKFKDVFAKKNEHVMVRYVVEELTLPGSTYAYYNTPNARLTEGAQKTFDKLNKNFWSAE